MRTIVLWVTLVLLFSSSCSGVRKIPEKVTATPEKPNPTLERVDPTPANMTREELEQAKKDIYRVVASQFCGNGVVYIYPEMALYSLDESDAPKEFRGASAETWSSYRSANDPNQRIAIFSDFPINCGYEFVSPMDVVCAGPETDCIIPYGFSPIGFNKAGTQALVYMYSDCSECGGSGEIYFLEKKQGVWVIVDFVTLWIS